MSKFRWLLCLTFAGLAAANLHAGQDQTRGRGVSSPPPEETEHALDSETAYPVLIDGRPIFFVRTSVGGFSAAERAAAISQRILNLARDASLSPDAVQVVKRQSWSEIVVGNTRICAITELEAKAAGTDRTILAEETTEIIRLTVSRYRQEHTWKNILRGAGISLLATLLLVAAIWVAFRIHGWLYGKYEAWLQTKREGEPASAAWRMFVTYGAGAVLSISAVIRWAIVLVLLNAYLTFVLYQFPHTQHLSAQTADWFLSKLALLGNAALEYAPNLLVVVIIAITTLFAVRANAAFFKEIEAQQITLKGFDPDWAPPTANLFRLLIIALGLVIVFPYLPGAESPAFQGVSLFVGLLLSLGSTSAVANMVAGTILTYTRAFRVGDVVKMGEDVGVVLEKSVFVTRLRTPKNLIVSIPNASVMSQAITNYSVEARKKSLILHTTVSIGYDTPWRQVEALLLLAAKRTTRILPEPSPYVLRKELSDFYIVYELNVYFDFSDSMVKAYSELHDNILDVFNEFGVQIMSPHYEADRGEKAWVPKERWYAAPARPVSPQGKE